LRKFATEGIPSESPKVGYDSPGVVDGVQLMFGGDMGHSVFRFHVKMNNTSPHSRRYVHKDLDFECETNQIAFLGCNKDNHETLHDTIMPKLNSDILQLLESCAVVVYNETDLSHLDVFILPKNINMNSILFKQESDDNDAVISTTMTYTLHDDPLVVQRREVRLPDHLGTLHIWQYKYKKIVSNFYDLYFADTALLSTLLGMEGAEGSRCLGCGITNANYGQHNCADNLLSIDYLESLLDLVLSQRQGKKYPRMLPITPQKMVIAVMHCEMGLVNKAIVFYLLWVVQNVLLFEKKDEAIVEAFIIAEENLSTALEDQKEARDRLAQNPSEENKNLEREATERKVQAVSDRAAANREYEKLVSQLKRKQGSFYYEMELILKALEVVREYYHGGEFNGVACIRILQKCNELFDKLEVKLIALRDPSKKSETEIRAFTAKFKNLFRLIDAVFSQIAGVETGLVPTPEEVQRLDTNLKAAKAQWISLGITTYQPKWHYVFDGLLIHQYVVMGGLADKSDQTIERCHQIWEEIRARCARINDFELRTKTELKHFRRAKHHLIRKELAIQKENRPKHSDESPRKRKMLEKAEEKREEKSDFRDTIPQPNAPNPEMTENQPTTN
jgi:hypothetical protein